MNTLTIEKIDALVGEVELVGSKSLTNRALLLSALSEGETLLTNILRSDDSKVMLEALAKLKVQVKEDATNPTVISIVGLGDTFNSTKEELDSFKDLSLEEALKLETELFLGNAGTAMRPLCAALALSGGIYKLTGEPRMYERPIGILVDALRSLGAHIEYLGTEGYPPLRIVGKKNPLLAKFKEASAAAGAAAAGAAGAAAGAADGACASSAGACSDGSYEVIVKGNTSSQFISALLMTAALLDKPFKLVVDGELISKPYVTMTCKLLARFGVEVKANGFESFEIAPSKLVSPSKYLVEGDASGATYFLAGAAIHGDVTVKGVGKDSVQGDAEFIKYLERMGAKIEIGDDYMRVISAGWKQDFDYKAYKEGKLSASSLPNRIYLNGLDDDFNDIPDAAMTFVPLAIFSMGDIVIRNIASWRVKETDRIAAMAKEMDKLGVIVDEGEDYISLSVWQEAVEEEEDPDGLFMPMTMREPSSKYMSIVSERSVIAFDTYNDHRMAMCMSLIAMDRTIVINDPECCKKTFPDYFERLEKLALRRPKD